jgi:glutathione synthase/RimK-type ligase-like ATP-grasp enzyme
VDTVTVAIVTCQAMPEDDPDEDLLLAALQDAGLEPTLAAWDDPNVHWSDYRLAVLRSAWNYIDHLEAFLDWAVRAGTETTLFNPVEVVQWNTHKGYLRTLAKQGVPVVPTAWLGVGEELDLPDLMADRGWHDVVAKPVVGAWSFMTDRITNPNTPEAREFWARLCQDREVMVQPYLRSVEEYGERSLIWIDGELTHAIRKSPRLGDADETVSDALPIAHVERELAEAVIADIPHELLYARIDLIRDDDGQPLLAELELVEPSLFLRQEPTALKRLVRGIAQRL